VTAKRLALCLLAHTPLGMTAAAQSVEVAAYGAAVTNSEIDQTRQARGLGLGADASFRLGRVEVMARGLTSSLGADFSVQPDYALHELELLASYDWRHGLSGYIGLGRRFLDPELVAQDVGMARVGVRARTLLTSLAEIRASASYMPLTRFSGGGDADLAVELSLGLRVGRQAGRISGRLDYRYERIDREVNGSSVPIRFSVARVGLGLVL
jgi:hypothetical protein